LHLRVGRAGHGLHHLLGSLGKVFQRGLVVAEDAYKSIDLLIDKLDRMLRKRATARQARRHTGSLAEMTSAAAFE